MEIFRIPDLFLPTTASPAPKQVFLHDYVSQTQHSKSKVALSCNVFSFLLEGVKHVENASQRIAITPTHFLVLKAGNCLMTERLSSQQNYHSLLLFFDHQKLSDFMVKYEIKRKVQTSSCDFLSFQSNDFIKTYVTSLQTLAQSQRVPSSHLLAIKLEELLLYLIEHYGYQVLDFLLTNVSLEEDIQFKKMIEGNISGSLSINELAFLCNMSLSTFKRRFKQHYDAAPSKWFQRKRLEKAKYLLQVKNYAPSEVYHEIGFENLSSFTQAFKKEFNITPKKYQLKQH